MSSRALQSGDASYWAPYVASLPREVPNPLCWSEAELRCLAGTRLEGAVKLQLEAQRVQAETWQGCMRNRLCIIIECV